MPSVSRYVCDVCHHLRRGSSQVGVCQCTRDCKREHSRRRYHVRVRRQREPVDVAAARTQLNIMEITIRETLQYLHDLNDRRNKLRRIVAASPETGRHERSVKS